VNGQLTGTGALLRHAIRLDRWKLLPWLVIIGVFPLASFAAYGSLFSSQLEAVALQLSLGANPAFSLLFGPATDLTTAIGFVTWRVQMFGMFFAALMAIFTVTRHTRAAEDTGQAELLDSGVVGQHARLASAVVLAWLASALVGLLVGGSLAAGGAPPASAFALGAVLGGMGFAFAGIAAVTAQLGSAARAANTLAAAVLSACYLLRGLGDTLDDGEWLLWTNPMGWAEAIRPATEDDFRPLLLLVGTGLVSAALAAWLSTRRDFGLGIIPGRAGPPRGKLGIWSLTTRLNRGPFWTWGVTFAALGSIYGLVTTTMSSVFADNPFVKQMLAARATSEEQLTFAFVEVLLLVLAIIGGVCGIQLALRFYAEEEERRAEWVLSGALSRLGHFAPTVTVALLAPGVGMVIGSLALAATANASGSPVDARDIILQGLAELPALWLATAVAIAAVGLAPQLRAVAWLLLVYWLLLTMFGPILKAPDWMLATSPFHVVPNIMEANPDFAPLWWTAVIAVVLVVSGLLGYRRRDLVCT
jgi:ABC-2 type transport system permease protein